jgi:tryptophanyl-tRNA synthetase
MSATTDSLGKINYDWEAQPGITNLLQILALSENRDQDEVNREWAGKDSYGELKKAVADSVSGLLTSLQASLEEVAASDIENKLAEAEATVSRVANATLLRVQTAVGLKQP